ncbi:MAG: transketolase family protein [Candidatus Taylorbacteria bacterium]|nr:transketolase family protein [Candidatus Taylorbacteria bacterium]
MLNPELKLNQKLFDTDVELKSMRLGFGEGLVKAAEFNENVVGLCADLAESTGMGQFKEKFPERFVEVGVAEQDLVTVASGMAAMGKIPFAASYAVFSPGRNWEQIRTTICYNNVPVKLIGTHGGVNVGPDGGSHQALEDIALMRVLPRMVVISPCDFYEAKKAVIAAAKTKDPTYIRLPREKSAVITTEDTPFKIGKATVLFRSGNSGRGLPSPHAEAMTRRSSNSSESRSRNSADIALIATGSLMIEVLKAAKRLEDQGKNVTVLNISTIKPLDEEAVIHLAREAGALITIEYHQIAGGLGSAVSECLAEHFPVSIEFIGIKDVFGQSGTPEELIKHYGLDANSIYGAAKRAMLRK